MGCCACAGVYDKITSQPPHLFLFVAEKEMFSKFSGLSEGIIPCVVIELVCLQTEVSSGSS